MKIIVVFYSCKSAVSVSHKFLLKLSHAFKVGYLLLVVFSWDNSPQGKLIRAWLSHGGEADKLLLCQGWEVLSQRSLLSKQLKKTPNFYKYYSHWWARHMPSKWHWKRKTIHLIWHLWTLINIIITRKWKSKSILYGIRRNYGLVLKPWQPGCQSNGAVKSPQEQNTIICYFVDN